MDGSLILLPVFRILTACCQRWRVRCTLSSSISRKNSLTCRLVSIWLASSNHVVCCFVYTDSSILYSCGYPSMWLIFCFTIYDYSYALLPILDVLLLMRLKLNASREFIFVDCWRWSWLLEWFVSSTFGRMAWYCGMSVFFVFLTSWCFC